MKAVVAALNQEKALVGAFSVITNLRMDLFEALVYSDMRYDACIHTSTLQVDHQALMRVYGALMWSLGKVRYEIEIESIPDILMMKQTRQ